MALLNFIGNDSATTFSCSPFSSFMKWLQDQKIVAFDTETNYTDSILSRKLKVLSFSDSQESTTWVVQWEFLTMSQQKVLCEELRYKLCVIHSVSFDYSVMKKHGVILEKVYNHIKNYVPHKTHYGALETGEKTCCPECGSTDLRHSQTRYSAAGTPRIQMQCNDCHKYHTVASRTYEAIIAKQFEGEIEG